MKTLFNIRQITVNLTLLHTPEGVSVEDWILCLETVQSILEKIEANPNNLKFRELNKSNEIFHKR
jgi:hypothetical protein